MLAVIVGENHLKYVNILYFIIYSEFCLHNDIWNFFLKQP